MERTKWVKPPASQGTLAVAVLPLCLTKDGGEFLPFQFQYLSETKTYPPLECFPPVQCKFDLFA